MFPLDASQMTLGLTQDAIPFADCKLALSQSTLGFGKSLLCLAQAVPSLDQVIRNFG